VCFGAESGLRWRHGGQVRAESPNPMGDVTPTHSRLAGAYLALGDDPQPPPGQRSVPRAVGALAAAIALALAAPVAWAAAGPDRPPADQPAATATGKAAPAPAADDDDGDA
jgi:hypothetical protein